MTYFWILIAIIAILVIAVIVTKNGLVQANNQVEEAYSTMDVYLKKRHDLIPNLINIVKGYASHEQSVLTQIAQANTAAAQAGSLSEQIKGEEKLNGAVGRLIAIAQAYPELKSNTNYDNLMKELTKVEEDIANSRKYYNATVREFNNKISSFPGSIFAGKDNLQKKPYFQVSSEAERQNIDVQL